MKFLELGMYPDNADKKECSSVRMMAIQYILCGAQLGGPMMVYTFVVLRKKKPKES